jgi:hypothetical protein
MLELIFYIVLTILVFYFLYKLVVAFSRLRQERKYINSLFL